MKFCECFTMIIKEKESSNPIEGAIKTADTIVSECNYTVKKLEKYGPN